jgi:hypothetical protein
MRLVSNAGKPIDMDLIKCDFRSFHELMWTGHIDLANDVARLEYAWVHFKQLRHNLLLKRFDSALQIVSSHSPVPYSA